MIEIGLIAILFVLSLAANAIIARWSAKKVLGLDVSLVRSMSIVAGRSFAALLAGFAIGYAIRLGLAEDSGTAQNTVQMIGVGAVALLSFLAYWLLLGKMTGTNISLVGMTKTVAVETGMLFACAFAIAIIMSTMFVLFQ